MSLWGVVPLFEAMSGLQIAQPSRRHLSQLNRFAWGAQRYLNPTLEPVPGFGPNPGQHNPGKTTWFDDNGWWGLAFLDAYRATGNGRWLTDAEIAQNFISVSGRTPRPGGPVGSGGTPITASMRVSPWPVARCSPPGSTRSPTTSTTWTTPSSTSPGPTSG